MLNLYYQFTMFEKLEDLAKNNKKISDFHIRAGSPLAYRATGEIIKVQEVIGSMNKKQANLYLGLMLKNHKYKELIIENQKFGITNLRGAINWKLDKR